MKFNLVSLKLSLRKADEEINFSKLSYFWGQMGAGKSSIARLVDYCLGGTIQLSPALQAEFVSATLTINLSEQPSASNDNATQRTCLRRGQMNKALVPS